VALILLLPLLTDSIDNIEGIISLRHLDLFPGMSEEDGILACVMLSLLMHKAEWGSACSVIEIASSGVPAGLFVIR
jgi:hypothetical protein